MGQVFELQIEESSNSELEVNYVAAVDRPAIEKNFLVFNADKVKLKFANDADGSFLIGAAMIPDMLIPRVDEDGNEYQVFFTKETIKAIAEKFFEKGYQNNVNLMHDPAQKMEGITFFQSVIKDTEKGIIGMQDDLPDGTWYLGARNKNEEVKAKVLSGELKGWSVEGMFKYKKKAVAMSAEDAFAKILDILNRIED